MFEPQQQIISDKIRSFCTEHHLPGPGEITWNPIPFTGEWGITTSFFQLAAQESKAIKEATGQSINVAKRAQELSEVIAAHFWFDAIAGVTLYFTDPENNALGAKVEFGF